MWYSSWDCGPQKFAGDDLEFLLGVEEDFPRLYPERRTCTLRDERRQNVNLVTIEVDVGVEWDYCIRPPSNVFLLREENLLMPLPIELVTMLSRDHDL